MAALDFPTSPVNGQIYTATTGQQWQYDSTAASWRSLGANTDLTIGKASPAINLNAAAAGQFRLVNGSTAGSQRWALALGDNTSESGSNAGSNFGLYRYSDGGDSLGQPLSIQRADGLIVMSGMTQLNGNVSAVGTGDAISVWNKTASGKYNIQYGYTNGSVRWAYSLGDNTAESGSNAGSNFTIFRYSDAGSYLGTPLSINRATGVATFESINVPGMWERVAEQAVTGGASVYSFTLPSTYRAFRVHCLGLQSSSSSVSATIYARVDLGSGYLSGASDYWQHGPFWEGGSGFVSNTANSLIQLTSSLNNSNAITGAFTLWPGSGTVQAEIANHGFIYVNSAPAWCHSIISGSVATSGRAVGLQIGNGGAINFASAGYIIIEGLRP